MGGARRKWVKQPHGEKWRRKGEGDWIKDMQRVGGMPGHGSLNGLGWGEGGREWGG